MSATRDTPPPGRPDEGRPGDVEAGAAERARKSFVLRLPEDLHAELRRWAAADLRSMNAQVEWILRDALRRRRGG